MYHAKGNGQRVSAARPCAAGARFSPAGLTGFGKVWSDGSALAVTATEPRHSRLPHNGRSRWHSGGNRHQERRCADDRAKKSHPGRGWQWRIAVSFLGRPWKDTFIIRTPSRPCHH